MAVESRKGTDCTKQFRLRRGLAYFKFNHPSPSFSFASNIDYFPASVEK